MGAEDFCHVDDPYHHIGRIIGIPYGAFQHDNVCLVVLEIILFGVKKADFGNDPAGRWLGVL